MKFLIDNWMLIALALTSGALLLWPTLAGGAAGGLAPAAAVNLINREKAVVVDVCEPGEFAAGHIVGARNLPLAGLEAGLPQAARNKSQPVLLVCAAGSRASRAQSVVKKLGYENVQVLAGGMRAWKEANLPIEKA